MNVYYIYKCEYFLYIVIYEFLINNFREFKLVKVDIEDSFMFFFFFIY